MKSLFRVVSVLFVIALAISTVGSASANNTWAVGNLVGLCAGTHIYQGPGGGYPYHTIVPEDNWTVKVIDGPRYFGGEAWWDTSRFAAGDPSGGTGWVKQSEADNCFGGGGDGGGGGGDSGDYAKKYSNPFNDVVSTVPKLGQNESPQQASDGFQWAFSNSKNAGYNISGRWFGAPDAHCTGKLHDGADYNNGDASFVYSIGKGKVIKVGWDDQGANLGYGLYIVIWHIAPNGESVYSFYGHLYEGTALVLEGQPVNRGDKIARQDTTGGANGQTHLHFELRKPNPKYEVGSQSSIFGYTSCPATEAELNEHFYNPVSYIVGDNWWEHFISPQPPSAETLKRDASATTSAIATEIAIDQGTINNGETSTTKSFWVNAWDVFLTIVHKIFGSATEITVYKPDGTIYGVYVVDDPNSLLLMIQDPEPGLWSYTIKGLDIPYENYPYAVSVGTRTVPFLDLGDSFGDSFSDLSGDLLAPTTDLELLPQSPNGNNGWYVTPVFISLTASDNSGGVGVAETRYIVNNSHVYVRYESMFELALEGINSLGYYSTDGMGNQEPLQSKEIKIDLTPPIVSVSTDQSEYTRVQPYTVHYSGYDPMPGSGLFSLTALFNNQPVIDGQVVDLFWLPLGTYTITATGEDYAGWVTTNNKTVTLIATIPSLQQAVKRLCAENYIIKPGTCTSLSQKLASALSAQQRGQNKTVVNILLAFQNELNAQKGKAVTLKAYDLLMMDSNYVIQVLGGK